MEQLVSLDLKSTTRAIAHRFNRRHSDVLRSVETFRRDSDDEEFNQRNFASVEYLDNKGENRKMYELTEEAALILVGRMTGKDAAKIQVELARAFTAMKRHIKDQRLVVDKQLQSQLADARNKVNAYEDLLVNKANTLAKLLGIAPSKSRPYFEKLEQLGLVEATPKVIHGFAYKPTSAGMAYVNHVDKNGIIHWKADVIKLLS